jgi:voltage-dependent anion channel protein 2
MSVPKFGDLSKAANDLFKDDFCAGDVKLTVKSKTANGVNLKVEGSKSTSSNAVSAEFESKYTTAAGITLKEVWTSANKVTTDVSMKNKLMKNHGASLAVSFSPTDGYQSFKLKSDYSTGKCCSDIVYDGRALTVNSVVSANAFLFGASAVINPSKSMSPASYSLAGGYRCGDINVNTLTKNGSDVEASVYHTPCSKVAAGAQINYSNKNSNTAFGLVGQYACDKDTTVKAKINTDMVLNMALKQAINKCVTLTLSAQVNAANLNSDKNKLGVEIELAN